MRHIAIGCAAALGGLVLSMPAAPGEKPRRKATTRPAASRPAEQLRDYPTSEYRIEEIEGWRVRVHRDLRTTHKALGDEAIKLLTAKLYDINRIVPKAAAAELHKVPIWISVRDRLGRHPCACYHPSRGWLKANRYNVDKARSVDILNAGTFVRWTTFSQPWMVLHELAHAYHHRVLPGGYGNEEIKAAYERARKSKSYESVLYYNGRKRRAYAMTNPQEYFAELSEAFFGMNDFYPFVRAEIRQHDPEGYKLLKKLWQRQADE